MATANTGFVLANTRQQIIAEIYLLLEAMEKIEANEEEHQNCCEVLMGLTSALSVPSSPMEN